MGLPRIRMYFRENAKKSKEKLVATANAKGSYKFSTMKDMRYVFKCQGVTYHIEEKKENFLKDFIKNEFAIDAFNMDFNIYKQNVTNDEYRQMKKNSNSNINSKQNHCVNNSFLKQR